MKNQRSSAWLVTATAFLAIAFSYPVSSAHAQAFGDIPADQRAEAMRAAQSQTQAQQAGFQEPEVRANYRESSGYGEPQSAETMLDKDGNPIIKPFGAELFSGGFRGLRADGLNPEYRILPGDQITLRIWGAVEVDRVLPVDAQGNIFIPSIGPVNVQGISHSALDGRVRQAVQKVYPDNVNVYTNLQGVQSVAVFVTGHVNRPGRYAGVPSDSVLYFLDQAGGIDDQLGSYRRVRVLRNGETLHTLDLYSFLREGKLNHAQLQNGDTILVETRGSTVTVHGDVGRAYQYELDQEILKGNTLIDLAQLKPGVSYALLRGVRDEQGMFSEYLPLEEFSQAQVSNGDEVLFMADQSENAIVVQLEGKFKGPSYYVLPKGTTLIELLNAVEVNPQETDYRNVSLRRKSVADRQREALLEGLRRLEMTYLGASSSTAEEAQIRVREAELISQFVARARQMQPNGRLVVTHNDQLVDVSLQDGDVVTLPQRTDSILITGEVYVPQAAVYRPGMSVHDYIERAGGFSAQADDDRILVVRANGEVRYSADIELRPGDEILVMPKVTSKNLQTASAITQILYQVAVATKVVLDL